jgi:hypothetical protein
VECGGGRNATAAKSLKIPVTETPELRGKDCPLNTYINFVLFVAIYFEWIP